MAHIFQYSLLSLGAGFLLTLLQQWAGTNFFTSFLKEDLLTILIAVLAINAGTMGTILTKIRDLIDGRKADSSCFAESKKALLCAIKEQIALIIVATLALLFRDCEQIKKVQNLQLLIDAVLAGTFVYSLTVLYDTAKGVMVIVDFDPNKGSEDEKSDKK